MEESLANFDSWLSRDNAGPWSLFSLTDAQKESLLWIGTSIVTVVAFWRGIPYRYQWVQVWYKDQQTEDWEIKSMVVLKWIPLLAPIKYLTVLFHEISHAIVGTATGGRVILIVVDFNEGGCTHFSRKHPPNYIATLPAGYIGSCICGCIFIILGFDTLSSKYAFIFFEGLTAVSLLVCIATLPKSFLLHKRHAIRKRFHMLRGDKSRADEHGDRAREQEDLLKKGEEADHDHVPPEAKDDLPSAKERMVSAEAIVLTNLIIGAIVAIAWFISDSLYLRFVILFIGVMNALYAIWDIFLDGIKYGTQTSDVTLMVRVWSRRRQIADKKLHTGRCKIREFQS
ncbi:peptidase M50B-like-domain-containing protein [Kockovaella imperatae]|uniref:Peptidase M50B-like-domain-containing protein n=1 Tax=Kockovaella imperatae TaxID=4999 RepID=A0A1Y1UDA8_9TREE|nr:peptidase M50B-like-domain-containing protein [Kockovaella imperatae]ORX36020.1 peptidase M50B-like-domain-containing protein [Kockovaella imperatae]